MNKRTFKLEVYQPEGQNFYRILITDEDGSDQPYKAALNSPVGTLEDKQERHNILDGLFQNVAYLLKRRVFPQDTKIYDQEITVHGVKLINPRYPDEPVLINQTPAVDPINQ